MITKLNIYSSFVSICFISFSSLAVAQTPRDSDAVLLFQPSIDYLIIQEPKEGACVVKFDINSGGNTQNIQPNCSSNVFTSEARRIVTNSIYSPKMVSGQPVLRTNMITSLKFEPNNELSKASLPVPLIKEVAHNNMQEDLKVEAMSRQLDDLTFKMDTIQCAEGAKKAGKSNKMLKGLGALAKVAGYGDVAKGIAYYDQAEKVMAQLNNKEKTLFNECMDERGRNSNVNLFEEKSPDISVQENTVVENFLPRPQLTSSEIYAEQETHRKIKNEIGRIAMVDRSFGFATMKTSEILSLGDTVFVMRGDGEAIKLNVAKSNIAGEYSLIPEKNIDLTFVQKDYPVRR